MPRFDNAGGTPRRRPAGPTVSLYLPGGRVACARGVLRMSDLLAVFLLRRRPNNRTLASSGLARPISQPVHLQVLPEKPFSLYILANSPGNIMDPLKCPQGRPFRVVNMFIFPAQFRGQIALSEARRKAIMGAATHPCFAGNSMFVQY